MSLDDEPGPRRGAFSRTGGSENGALPVGRGEPRHYHLLWDDELEELRPVLSVIVERLDDVIAYWYQLYILHFGDQRSLSEHEFREIFHTSLSRNTRDLLEGDMDRYAVHTIHTGELLSERRVPFS